MIATQQVKTLETRPVEDNESFIRFCGNKISIRALITLILVITLCVMTYKDPLNYVEIFKFTFASISSFYFGQQTKR